MIPTPELFQLVEQGLACTYLLLRGWAEMVSDV